MEAQQSNFKHVLSFLLGLGLERRFPPQAHAAVLWTESFPWLCFFSHGFLNTQLLRETTDDRLLCKVDTPRLRGEDGRLFGGSVSKD